ncbi:MAG: SEC-C metal-binding domain-containing protein [Kofleriaceae bacterium]
MADVVIPAETVEQTITAFTRLDQRGDRKAMNKLAGRLQKEQPFLLQYAASARAEHGDTVGEAAVFYATLVWSMFDRNQADTLPRITDENIAAAAEVVAKAIAAEDGVAERPPYQRTAAALAERQPHVVAKLRELLEEDVREEAMTAETCATIVTPTQVVLEAFDAAVSGRRPGLRQGTVVHEGDKIGRNDPCTCGSGKKWKKCHGAAA